MQKAKTSGKSSDPKATKGAVKPVSVESKEDEEDKESVDEAQAKTESDEEEEKEVKEESAPEFKGDVSDRMSRYTTLLERAGTQN